MSDTQRPVAPRDGGLAFWIGLGAGVPLIVVGVVGLLAASDATRPVEAAGYFVGVAIAHDLILVPLVLAAGVALGKLAPSRAKPWLQAGLIVTAPVALL